MGIENDWDILRSEGEGFGMVNYDSYSEDEAEAARIHIFLEKIVDGFKGNIQFLGVEEVSIEALSNITEKEKKELVEMVKKHFVPSICHNHAKDIVNDESYIENIEEGDPPEGPIVDYEINEKNLISFLLVDGAESLRSHIKEMLGPAKWQELEDTEMERIFDNERWHKGASAG